MMRAARRTFSEMKPRTRFVIKTFNKISPQGLERFRPEMYRIKPGEDQPPVAHAIMLRSHKIQDSDVPLTCRAIVRCGAGTNNCNVPRMTELGIPVFNTPGANANAVKELVLCGLLMASRGIYEGASHMTKLHEEGTAHERIEKDKAMFGGRELTGKTLGVVGLGAIGAAVAHSAIALGMNVVGYDPGLSVEAALRLPSGDMEMASLEDLVEQSDYVTLHAPYIKDVTHHLINAELLNKMKPDASLLNFARGELVDEAALNQRYENGGGGRYITDFAVSEELYPRPNVISIPHLGASTEEAEANAAAMAADTVQLYLETGTIKDSVNFPACSLPARDEEHVHRCTVITENRPGMLGDLMSVFGDANLNVVQQINTSKGELAYNVIDLELPRTADGKVDVGEFGTGDFDKLQAKIMEVSGVKSTRFISDWCPGTGYAVKVDDQIIGIGVDSPEQASYAEL
jgi:D-3-phosphoglycerate dehydrogenase